ncbi:amidohydrolase family protein [Pedobacter sp. LMG 31464]|uniref:Amidohydrolase family protein n=1 Tax=Pedobacter planticolens TaxID=2679964 RepID=A0A923IX96_9SPHI|nr:amidohydrolase family protein [Pedobacter planticolens]MBB2146082.1 amidohydrolase family protein [Pedobacter planticolens]
MNKYISTAIALFASVSLTYGQATISPAKAQSQRVIIMGATIHTGDGKVIENGYLIFDKGKITGVGDATVVKLNLTDARMITANGKHIYPGFIAPTTNLGLIEIEAVKATVDDDELGENNAHIRSIIAYNTDSKVINTLRSNGILMAQITPSGGTISGSSSVVQLDAWNWEDAAIKKEDAMHMTWPVAPRGRGGFGGGGRLPVGTTAVDPNERTNNAIAELNKFFSEAKVYTETPPAVTNTRLAALKGVFNGSEKLFITADGQKEIVAAVNFAKSFGITPVIVGGDEAYLLTDFLKANNVIVVVKKPQSLPNNVDDDVNMPYKNVARLSNAGVTVVISFDGGDGFWRQRNLPFMAGTASAWGMSKEDALKTITLNAAKAMGVDKTTGSLEIGKDATFFISGGDALDMIGNKVEQAFIQGRDINLDNLHKQLDKKYSDKYGIK